MKILVLFVLYFVLFATLGVFGIANCARAQAPVSMPDVSVYRVQVPFNDPYATVQAPSIPLPSGTEYQPHDPKLTIIMDSAIVSQIEQYRKSSGTVSELPGYRIQIYSGNKGGAQNSRFNFMGEYDNIDVYTLYEQPLFKVRIGNYVSQAEAEKFCRELKLRYPSAFIVPETIKLSR